MNYLQPNDNTIKSCIFNIRGRQVIIDYHLAKLYQVETRVLKQSVKRNSERFPDDFMFYLTTEESQDIISKGVSQSVIPPGYNIGTSTMLAFTEEGVSMLSAVLKSDVAIQMSISIIRVFVNLRSTIYRITTDELHYNQLNSEIQKLRIELNEILRDQNEINEDTRIQQESIALQLDNINNAIAELQSERNQKLLNSQRNPIGFHTK